MLDFTYPNEDDGTPPSANREFAKPADSTPSDVLSAAHHYRSLGFSVIPIWRTTKKPRCKWKAYQSQPMTHEEIDKMFEPDDNIAIVGGIASANLFVIDVDNPDVFDQTLREILEPYMQATLIVGSATQGRFHIYFYCSVPVQSRKLREHGCEVKAHGGYWLAPPSEVSGRQYSISSGSFKKILDIDINQIPQLGLTTWTPNAPRVPGRLLIPANNEFALLPGDNRPRDISPIHWDCLHNGNYEEYGYRKGNPQSSRSELEFSLILRLVSLGWQETEILNLFNQFAHSNSKFAGKSENDKVNYIRSAFEKARCSFLTSLSEDSTARQTLCAIAHLITDASLWSGRHASIDREVLLLLLIIQYRTSKIEIGASLREIAENVGSQVRTICNSLRRLKAYGFIRSLANGSFLRPAIFEVSYPPGEEVLDGYILIQPLDVLECIHLSPMREDVFRRAGLGKPGHQIVQFLMLKPASGFHEIETAVTCSRKTTRKHLSRLIRLGVIVQNADLYRVESLDFDEMAKEFRTQGIGFRQRKRHQNERYMFRRRKKP